MQYFYIKDQRIKQLENENIKLQEKVAALEHNVEVLTQAVLHASKERFGASSEKTPQMEGQCIFDELLKQIVTVDEIESDVKVVNIKEHKRPIRKKGDREKLIKELPHEVVECILNPEEAICGTCGSELEVIGKKRLDQKWNLYQQNW